MKKSAEKLAGMLEEAAAYDKNMMIDLYERLHCIKGCVYVPFFGIFAASWHEDGEWHFGMLSHDKKHEKCWRYGWDDSSTCFPAKDLVEHVIYPEYEEWDVKGYINRDMDNFQVEFYGLNK